MRIYTKIAYKWSGIAYEIDSFDSYEYTGTLEMCCGATPLQGQIANSQSAFMQQMQQQATSVFGSSSSVFQNLMNTFAPTVVAGPNQQGFSPQELGNLNSEAITQTGQSYQNEKAAVGNAMAATGGGNTPLPSGSQIGENLQLAENAGNQTATELAGITAQNYAVGRQNYNEAVSGMARAPGVFGAATGAGSAATSAGTAAANTANQVAQEQQSWMQPVAGILGGVASAATGGLMGAMGNGSNGGSGNLTSTLNNFGGTIAGPNGNMPQANMGNLGFTNGAIPQSAFPNLP